MRNVSEKSCTENQNTYFEFSDFFPPENRVFFKNNVQKYLTAGQATGDDMEHA
jgi:hypothetical protein